MSVNNLTRIIALLCAVCFFVMPVNDAAAYLGDRTLKLGMSGYDVWQLQKNLDYLGYPVGDLDGKFGWQTFNAVKNFQWRNGLKTDGVVGKKTASAIIAQVSGNQAQRPRTAAAASRSGLQFSRQDIYDLARVVHGEARGESFEGQVAVAAVVLNRLQSGLFGRTVQDVIFQPWAFTAVHDRQFYLTPNESAFRAVNAAIKGWDPTGGALYYWNPQTATSRWVWSRPIVNKIGNHVFAY
ncbi:spore cortex-lytic enzyme [Desulforamulus hydrothermalis]|uniref:Spore cortex-lytic enzyme n=1 Tax=Desulforamulus hydrothermalis Lam5 = DSM 18033 TaxID=1121428 RepID=K8E188_9FIRM|nr:spore cortex-lytic enzyme [Desulforamulus hydrothermalis]CCO09415.1 Spore cortex-lytic enzyme [Desulforamulus hydrothermalis Lam5 = DSM 18033]SHH08644.1 N-acetylmuramoyl-L-alanine amidase [Desulforamulus hydrothermalis Lam5 = DSM 18033]